jgi:Uma2 family endonuclease
MTFKTRLTVEEFDEWVLLPENIERNFEYIGGEVVEVVSNSTSSWITFNIAGFLFIYLRQNPIGEATLTDGGYQVSGERYIPDIAFYYTHKRLDAAYNPNPPDLAVEVLSPSNTPKEISIKVTNYLAANTVVWVVYPDTKEVIVHVPGQPAKILHIDDVLDGGNVLPGFSVAIKDIFTPLGR